MAATQPGVNATASQNPLAADASPMNEMAHKLKTKVDRKRYALRKQTVEPVFGIIKSAWGSGSFCRAAWRR